MILSRTYVNLSGILLFFLLFAGACKDSTPLYFTEPQPAGKKNKTSFKNKYLGTYKCAKDSTEIRVYRDAVVRLTSYRGTFSRGRIDSLGLVLRNGYVIYTGKGKKDSVPVIPAGDLVSVNYSNTDTLFRVSEKGVLRYYKKKYFLNTQEGKKGWWTVRTLGFENEYSNDGADKKKVLVIRRFYQFNNKVKVDVRDLWSWKDLRENRVDPEVSVKSPKKKELKRLMSTTIYRPEHKCSKMPEGKGGEK